MKNGSGILKFFKKGINSKIIEKYEGEFKNNEITGVGIYHYSNKDKYEGNFINNKKNGIGKLFSYENKETYEGEFKNNMKDGNGLIIDKYETIFNVIFDKNNIISKKRYEKAFEIEIIKKIKIDLPYEFKCPISLSLMLNPVIASDGHTYDKLYLMKLYSDNVISKSPITREVLDKNILISNITLKKLIDDLIKINPLVVKM